MEKKQMLSLGSPVAQAVFCAALQGVLSNRSFNVEFRDAPERAVEIARRVVVEMQTRTS